METAERQGPTTTERSDANPKALVGPLASTLSPSFDGPIALRPPIILPPPRPEPANVRQRTIYTLEECIADAQKYSSRTKWQFLSGKIYDHARLMRWTDACCEHMSNKRVVHPIGYWTKERIGAIAKEFTSRTQWAGLHNQSYNYARSKGWLNELSQHMAIPRSATKSVPKPPAPVRAVVRPDGYWTKDRVLKCARQYQSRTQFSLMDHAAYNKALANDWIGEATAHMSGKKPATPRGYWTEQRCADIAKGYDRRVVWAAYHSQSYNMARKNGWLEKLTRHMAPPATKGRPKVEAAPKKAELPIVLPNKIERPSITPKEAERTISVSKEFRFAIENAGLMPRGYWTKARVLAAAKLYSSRSEWRSANPWMYSYATKKGYLTSATRHMVDPNYMRYARASSSVSITSLNKPVATVRPKATPPAPVLEKPVAPKPIEALPTPVAAPPVVTTPVVASTPAPTLNWKQRIRRFFGD